MGDSGSYQTLLLLVRQLCAAHHKAVHVVQHRIPQGVVRIRGLLPSICLSFCHEFPTCGVSKFAAEGTPNAEESIQPR